MFTQRFLGFVYLLVIQYDVKKINMKMSKKYCKVDIFFISNQNS